MPQTNKPIKNKTFMRKTISPILMFLLTLLGGASAWAQTTWYSPGSRLSIADIAVGTDVFIYSMCRVDGTGANYSRFIVSNGNAAGTLNATPGSLLTQSTNAIWQVASKEDVFGTGTNASVVVGCKLTFKRNKGADGFLGIDGSTDETTAGDAHTMVVTQWKSDPSVAETSKSGTDVWFEDINGNPVQQANMTASDPIYLVSALSGKSLNTSNGNFNTDKANGYPIAFYRVKTQTITSSAEAFTQTAAVDGTNWASGVKWLKMKINSGSWSYVETGSLYRDEQGLTINHPKCSGNISALWAIAGDATNGYQFYNLQAGPSKVLGMTGTEGGARVNMVDATSPGEGVTTTFDIQYHETQGYWYIKKHNGNDDYINCRHPYIAHWGTSLAYGNPGSSFAFELVDLDAFVSADKAATLSLIEDWKKVPAIWSDASTQYNNINGVSFSEGGVTAAELKNFADIKQAASESFLALDGTRFTAANRDSRTAARIGAYMYLDASSNKLKGRTTSTHTYDEVMTLKPNDNFTFKIYNAAADKYVGTPGGSTTSGVALSNAANFDLFTSNGYNDNVVVFCVNGTATMHLLNGLDVSNYSSTSDMASRWLLSTDLSRYELKTAIDAATTWKENLNTLTTRYANANLISAKPMRVVYTLSSAIATAQAALQTSNGTQETRTAAKETLNTALQTAQGAWLGELGTSQQYRLRSASIGENYYLTMGQEKDGESQGNARLLTKDESNPDQIFTLVPGTDANAGKYIIVSNGQQLTDLADRNTEMTAAGTPYTFEAADLANGIFRVRTTLGLLGLNSDVTVDNLSTEPNNYVYSNKAVTDNSSWYLEPITPTDGTTGTDALAVTYNTQGWYEKYLPNIISFESIPVVAAYKTVRDNAKSIIDGQTSATQANINTAKLELELSYTELLQNFIMQAAATQSYRLKYKCDNEDVFYMTITPDVTEDNVVNVMTVTGKDLANKKQIFNLIPATGADAGKFYIKECTTNKRISFSSHSGNYWWNPGLSESQGILFTPEYTTLEGVDGIVLRLKNSNGSHYTDKYLAPSSATPTNGEYAYTNQNGTTETSETYGYWIIEPSVSSDLISALQTKIPQAEAYETHLGSGVNQYSNTAGWNNDFLSAQNDVASAYVNSTGSYEGKEPNNTFLQSYIEDYTNFLGSISINQPEVGKLYRFKGKVSGKYMCASTTGQMSMVDANDGISTIFMLVQGDNVDSQPGYKFLSYQTGYYNKETHSNGALVAAAQSVRFYQAEDNAIGYYTLKSNYSGSKYTYDNGNKTAEGQPAPCVDRNLTYAANNCDWEIEEVTELPISVTNGYSKLGTFVSPVALNKDASLLKFYTGTIGTDSYFHVTEFTEDVIPAGVPFLIEYQTGGTYADGCVKLPVYSGSESVNNSVTTDLQGGFETVATPTIEGYTIYTLQKTNTNTQEFWRYTGDIIKGFRAYLRVPAGTLVRGMIFGGTTTDIEGATTEETAAPVIYDLSGRRVQHAAKGMYIVNGKKMYVK